MAGGDGYRVYQNLWRHNERFFAVLADPAAAGLQRGLSVNQKVVALPAVDAAAFVRNVNASAVRGNTLVLDFPFPAFPSNLGHWSEVVLPVHTMVEQGTWFRDCAGSSGSHGTIDTVVLLNLYERELIDWFAATLKIALAPARPRDAPLPRIVDTAYVNNMHNLSWTVFENYISANDRYTDRDGIANRMASASPDGSWPFVFRTPSSAQRFRTAAYQLARVSMPPAWTPGAAGLPRVITFMTGAKGDQVVNHYEVAAMLWRVAAPRGWAVRQFSATATAPFAEQVLTMSRTGVLVSRHGPLLANAMFLPDGAATYELLPYNWEWHQLSELYRNLTASVGTLHHMAWRPREPRWAAYASAADAKFGPWNATECNSRPCLAAHARAGLRVDLEMVQSDLEALLDSMTSDSHACRDAACHVRMLRRPWPRA